MLTIRAMSDGTGYSARHLEHSDYYAEGERVTGQWQGRGAELLGLSGEVQSEHFEAVRQGLDPESGEFIRQRHSADRTATDGSIQSRGRNLYDFTISAPKSVSIMAELGGDARLVEAHRKAVQETLQELECSAASRVRRDGANDNRITGNLVLAVYHHDTSRELDPQLHTHAVSANLTYDGAEGRWKALQASGIYEQRAYLTEVYRNALAREVRALGYEIDDRRSSKGKNLGFEIKGVSDELLAKYSQRSEQRDRAIAEFVESKGRQPSDNEIAVLVRESRADKLVEISTSEVHSHQAARLTPKDSLILEQVRETAFERSQTQRSEMENAYNQSASNYLWNNMWSLPYTSQIKDGSGNQLSLTQYNYDENTPALSGLTSSYQWFKPSGTYRGNNTSTLRWLNSGTFTCPNGNSGGSNGYLISKKTYFDDGMLNTSADPCGNTTTYAYSLYYWGALATSVTNALSQVTTNTYDFNTSLLASTTDPNTLTTSYSYDSMWRLAQVSYPDKGWTSYCYTDEGGSTCSQSGPPYAVVTTKALNLQGLNEVSTTLYDGLGRLSETELTSDPSGTTYTETTYDAIGRKYQVYDPTRCSAITTNCGETTWGYTTYNYDPLNRITSVVEPDNSTVTTNYASFPCTIVTDEVGISRKSCVDGLGRMTGVWEDPGTSPHLNYETDYTYDALNNLLGVKQWGGVSGSANARTRGFTYDSLSRLLTATNPESGIVTYTYYANGNVQSKTDARNITVNYGYDALNRVLSKTYSNDPAGTPSSCYQYDSSSVTNGIGRLTNEWTQKLSAGASCPNTPPATGLWTQRSILAYDPMGRIWNEQQCTPSNCASGTFYAPAYTYDWAGNVTSLTDGVTPIPSSAQSQTSPCPTSSTPPTTRAFFNCFDGANRLQTVTSNWYDGTHPATLFSAQSSSPPAYAPFGGLQNAAFGSGLTLSRTYNNRLWITGETDTGSVVSSPTSASATVAITGAEQSQ
jgi:conjugative relaxase-like TrwC/TraI family protein